MLGAPLDPPGGTRRIGLAQEVAQRIGRRKGEGPGGTHDHTDLRQGIPAEEALRIRQVVEDAQGAAPRAVPGELLADGEPGSRSVGSDQQPLRRAPDLPRLDEPERLERPAILDPPRRALDLHPQHRVVRDQLELAVLAADALRRLPGGDLVKRRHHPRLAREGVTDRPARGPVDLHEVQLVTRPRLHVELDLVRAGIHDAELDLLDERATGRPRLAIARGVEADGSPVEPDFHESGLGTAQRADAEPVAADRGLEGEDQPLGPIRRGLTGDPQGQEPGLRDLEGGLELARGQALLGAEAQHELLDALVLDRGLDRRREVAQQLHGTLDPV